MDDGEPLHKLTTACCVDDAREIDILFTSYIIPWCTCYSCYAGVGKKLPHTRVENFASYARAPPCGRLTPLATLGQGRMHLTHVKGGEKEEAHDLVQTANNNNNRYCHKRAACAELIARAELITLLCCAACLLAVSGSDRQYGCNLRGGKNMGTERDQITIIMNKKQKTSTQHQSL